jgi:hypothetical protein
MEEREVIEPNAIVVVLCRRQIRLGLRIRDRAKARQTNYISRRIWILPPNKT